MAKAKSKKKEKKLKKRQERCEQVVAISPDRFVLMVISAMATPDASPVTMLLMFGAMIVLYEASLLVARIVLGNRLKKRQEEEAREAAEDAEIAAEWDETKKKAKKKFKEHMDLDD